MTPLQSIPFVIWNRQSFKELMEVTYNVKNIVHFCILLDFLVLELYYIMEVAYFV